MQSNSLQFDDCVPRCECLTDRTKLNIKEVSSSVDEVTNFKTSERLHGFSSKSLSALVSSDVVCALMSSVAPHKSNLNFVLSLLSNTGNISSLSSAKRTLRTNSFHVRREPLCESRCGKENFMNKAPLCPANISVPEGQQHNSRELIPILETLAILGMVVMCKRWSIELGYQHLSDIQS